jgi:hypothetical protein
MFKNQQKQVYQTPQIERIELDNEIALQLESAPAFGPGEARMNIPEHFKNDPFKSSAI